MRVHGKLALILTARLELEVQDKVVTTWELERNFERI